MNNTKKICLSCGGQLTKYGQVSGYNVYKCLVCGMGETEDKSQPDYKAYHRDTTYLEESAQFRNIFEKRRQIVEKFTSHGKILEVGSSVGTLLSIFKKQGWEVQGIEPSLYAVEVAVKRGIPTNEGMFENTTLTQGTFDVVIFNHVLEHVKNPAEVLKKTSEVLKKGGIVLVDVPNFGSLRSKVQRAGWGYLYPNEHKWHFAKDSLSRLMVQSGLETIYWETRSGVWDYGNPISEIWQSFIGFKLRFFKNILFLIPNYFVSILGMGSGLTIVGKKK